MLPRGPSPAQHNGINMIQDHLNAKPLVVAVKEFDLDGCQALGS